MARSHGADSIAVLVGLAAAGYALGSGQSFLSAPGPSTLSAPRLGHRQQRCDRGAAGHGGPKAGVALSALSALGVAAGVALVLRGGALRAGARRGPTARRVATVDEAPAKFDVAAQPGVLSPAGEPGVSYWDPAGLANGIDEATFRQYRKAELKHGRVCMLAVTGLVAQHTWRFNLLYPYSESYSPFDFSDVPSGFAALGVNKAAGFLGLIVIVAGLVELRASDDGRRPGDFGDPLNFAEGYGLDFDGGDDAALWQNFELSHGRLAMIGFLGAALAEYATGLDALDQWGRAGSACARTFAILGAGQEVPALESFF